MSDSESKTKEVEDNNEKKKSKKPTKNKEVYMTWGKYKGKTVKEVISFDVKYARWLLKQEFVRKFEDIYKVLVEFVPPKPEDE